MAPINIDGSPVQDITIDGQPVTEVTVDGDVVFPAIRDVDTFEDGDLSEYFGDTGAYTIQTSTVFEGSRALRGFDGGVMASTNGLNSYPERGDTFSVRNRWTSSATFHSSAILFGLSSTSDHYQVGIADRNPDNFSIRVTDGGTVTVLADDAVDVNGGEWYEIRVRWNSSDLIEAKLLSQSGSTISTISATDSTHASNSGIGFRFNSPQDYFADNFIKGVQF